jgi:hypothetical protein
MMSAKDLSDFPKWVEENTDLVKGMEVFGVPVHLMTKKELIATIGYLCKKSFCKKCKKYLLTNGDTDGIISHRH